MVRVSVPLRLLPLKLVLLLVNFGESESKRSILFITTFLFFSFLLFSSELLRALCFYYEREWTLDRLFIHFLRV